MFIVFMNPLLGFLYLIVGIKFLRRLKAYDFELYYSTKWKMILMIVLWFLSMLFKAGSYLFYTMKNFGGVNDEFYRVPINTVLIFFGEWVPIILYIYT